LCRRHRGGGDRETDGPGQDALALFGVILDELGLVDALLERPA